MPDEAVAAVNLGGEEPSSNSEIVGDVVSSGGENGKEARKPRISESVILNDGLCTSITLLF